MAINLADLIEFTKMFKKKKEKIGEKWLGKFKEAFPKDRESKKYLKELRGNLYEKL
jgi:hypothetical protein